MSAQLLESRGWQRLAMPASLLLNLFLIAIIGGHLLRHRAYEVNPGSPSLPRILASAQASLSPADAAAFGEVMRTGASRYLESAGRLAKARSELERQIAADPYDAAAAKQAFAAWQESGAKFLSDIRDPLIDAFGRVSPEGRQKLIAIRHKTQQGLRIP